MKQNAKSDELSPARGERQGGEGLLNSPAVLRALQNRRAILAAERLAALSASTPSGIGPAGPLLAPSAPTPAGQTADPLDGGVSLAGVSGSSPNVVPQEAIRGLLRSRDSEPRQEGQQPVPDPIEYSNLYDALDDQDDDEDPSSTSSPLNPTTTQVSTGSGVSGSDEGGSYMQALMRAGGTTPPKAVSTSTTRKSSRRETRRCVACGTVQAASWHMTDATTVRRWQLEHARVGIRL